MIATVTLNPAIDQTVTCADFRPNVVNRAEAVQFDPGGKGINVAACLADAGYAVVVTGFLGRENARFFEDLFARRGIVDRFVRIPGRTRTSVKIVDPARQETTDVNVPGLAPPADALDRLTKALDELCQRCEWFVLTGSLPPGVPDDLYATLVARLKARGKRTVLDTSGDGLRAAVAAGPTIIKPNLAELRQIVGAGLEDHEAIVVAARTLASRHGMALVVVSMGSEGAILVDGERAVWARPPHVRVESTVGAGDGMVAGLVAAQTVGLDLAACARLATAYAVGGITRIGPSLPAEEKLRGYRERVSLVAL